MRKDNLIKIRLDISYGQIIYLYGYVLIEKDYKLWASASEFRQMQKERKLEKFYINLII